VTAGIGPGLHQDRSPNTYGPLAAFAFANAKPFLAVEPVNAGDAESLTFTSQQNEQPSITEPAPLIGQVAQQFPLLRLS
jgi:hypothetical protein